MAIEGDSNHHHSIINGVHKVNFDNPRKFGKRFKANAKETLFPDDPFHQFKGQPFFKKALIGLQYFVPIAEWLPKYNFKLFRYDLLAGITIASLAIPQGISYAKLASIPPIIGLYSSFVPPLVYAVFGSSKKLAVGTVAAGSLLIHEVIEQKVHVKDNPTLHLHLVFTAAFFSGVFQFLLGVFRLGILVDFLSHSTITGFMGGTAVIICLQQLKGMLGLQHFTTKTDVVSVFKAIFKYRNEWQWEPAVIGVAFLIFLQITRFIRSKNPKLFWVSAIAPMVTVVIGCLFAYFSHADKHHIAIVGDLKKGLNPLSISDLNFDSQYLMLPLQAGIISAVLALAEGIAIGRSFAQKNEQTDGNKEMIAFGLMNIVGSCTSCYLTTGPFSKTAVNYNAGAKTQMSNVVMSICLMLTLLFLAPAFSYTPLVALSAIIMSAMFGLIKYNEAYHLYKVDKFDFVICMSAFMGVAFISMDVGLGISVGLALIRALLYVARPNTTKLGNIPDSSLYRDTEQYPGSTEIPGVLIIQMGSPLYFANSNYIKDRISRWIRDEREISDSKGADLECIILDMGAVGTIDASGIETLSEIRKDMESSGIKVVLVNPRLDVLEKLIIAKFIDEIGKESVFLSIEDALTSCTFSLQTADEKHSSEVGAHH